MAALIDRRTLLAGLGALTCHPVTAFAQAPLRIASLDYALTETLLVLGHPPIAQTAAGDWVKWVVEPPLPDGVADLGSSLEVNFERLALLTPDLILTTDYVARQEAALSRIAPVQRMTLYAEGAEPLERASAITLDLGRRLGRDDAARTYLRQVDALFTTCRARLASARPTPVILVNFMDARHVRVYGGTGLYQAVLDRIGLTNAFRGATNYWGFATVGIEELATDADVRLIAFEPLPPDTMPTLAESPLWRGLPFVKAGAVSVLPPVLMFGALPSAARFADLLTEALTGTASGKPAGAPILDENSAA